MQQQTCTTYAIDSGSEVKVKHNVHVRPLARLTAVPAEVLAVLLLALLRIYADRWSALITQADAARLMGCSS